jgi:hypothetical protein
MLKYADKKSNKKQPYLEAVSLCLARSETNCEREKPHRG